MVAILRPNTSWTNNGTAQPTTDFGADGVDALTGLPVDDEDMGIVVSQPGGRIFGTIRYIDGAGSADVTINGIYATGGDLEDLASFGTTGRHGYSGFSTTTLAPGETMAFWFDIAVARFAVAVSGTTTGAGRLVVAVRSAR